ncbi:GTP-binding protein LepA, partial [Campylobacter coli]|nr:GTP-binding protein LepA [Campylobacter coli]
FLLFKTDRTNTDKDNEITQITNITSKELSSLFSYEFKSDNGVSFNKRGSGVKRLFY